MRFLQQGVADFGYPGSPMALPNAAVALLRPHHDLGRETTSKQEKIALFMARKGEVQGSLFCFGERCAKGVYKAALMAAGSGHDRIRHSI